MLSTSEGGWRRIKWDSEPTYGDYSELRKPLPPPPPGLEWRRLSDGRWELSSTREESGDAPSTDPEPATPTPHETEPEPAVPADGEEEEIAVHVILPSDTLAGLCGDTRRPPITRRLNGGDRDLRAARACAWRCAEPCAPRALASRRGLARRSSRSCGTRATSLPEAEYYLGEHAGRLDAACAAARADGRGRPVGSPRAKPRIRRAFRSSSTTRRRAPRTGTRRSACAETPAMSAPATAAGRPAAPREPEAMQSDDPLGALESSFLAPPLLAVPATGPVGFADRVCTPPPPECAACLTMPRSCHRIEARTQRHWGVRPSRRCRNPQARTAWLARHRRRARDRVPRGSSRSKHASSQRWRPDRRHP